jgi:large subunit ribosomal protein L3
MSAILGRKIGITTAIGADGNSFPVSVVKAGPCKVLECKTKEKHGYDAIVLGFEEVEGSKIKSKALLGLFKKLGASCYRVVREFRSTQAAVGSETNVQSFNIGDIVKVEGVSKGHGWTSVIKKWNFATGRESHGGNCQRKMGSSGMHTWPAHVIKGKKMSGRWGSENITLRSVEVVGLVAEEGLLLLKGPLPGGKGGLIKIETLQAAAQQAA